MAYYTTQGVVLKNQNYKEADKLLTIFTADEGKVPAVAKGVRKPKSSMRGGVQLFSHSEFMFYRGRSSLETLTQCQVVESFSMLRGDLERFAFAAYLAELTVELVPEREPNRELFYLLLTCMHLLQHHEPALVTRVFEIRLANLLGYAPELERCIHCGKKMEGEVLFNLEEGGITCPACAAGNGSLVKVSQGAAASLRALSRMELDKCVRLKLSTGHQQELAALLGRYIELRLDRKLKSRRFLDSLSGPA